MATTPSRNAGRQEIYFYINRERPTSASGAGPRRTKTPLGPSQGEFLRLRAPNGYNLRADPFERGTESQFHSDWLAHRIFLIVPAQAIATK
jgi:hypothetical protein